jgi:hypothetical protein
VACIWVKPPLCIPNIPKRNLSYTPNFSRHETSPCFLAAVQLSPINMSLASGVV